MELKVKTLKILPIISFPIILTIGILLIPVVSDYANHALAEQAVGQVLRWLFGHLISALSFGIGILAAYSIASYLENYQTKIKGIITLWLITLGGTLYATGLGADGVGPLAIVAGWGLYAVSLGALLVYLPIGIQMHHHA